MSFEAFTKEELVAALKETQSELTKRESIREEIRWLEDALRKRTHALNERTKELDCLHRIAQDLQKAGAPNQAFFQTVVSRIPPAFEKTERAEACLEINGARFCTPGYSLAGSCLKISIERNSAPFGSITIAYRSGKKSPPPFSTEEKRLLETLAAWIGALL